MSTVNGHSVYHLLPFIFFPGIVILLLAHLALSLFRPGYTMDTLPRWCRIAGLVLVLVIIIVCIVLSRYPAFVWL